MTFVYTPWLRLRESAQRCWNKFYIEICTVLGFYTAHKGSFKDVSGHRIFPIIKGQAIQEEFLGGLDP